MMNKILICFATFTSLHVIPCIPIHEHRCLKCNNWSNKYYGLGGIEHSPLVLSYEVPKWKRHAEEEGLHLTKHSADIAELSFISEDQEGYLSTGRPQGKEKTVLGVLNDGSHVNDTEDDPTSMDEGAGRQKRNAKELLKVSSKMKDGKEEKVSDKDDDQKIKGKIFKNTDNEKLENKTIIHNRKHDKKIHEKEVDDAGKQKKTTHDDDKENESKHKTSAEKKADKKIKNSNAIKKEQYEGGHESKEIDSEDLPKKSLDDEKYTKNTKWEEHGEEKDANKQFSARNFLGATITATLPTALATTVSSTSSATTTTPATIAPITTVVPPINVVTAAAGGPPLSLITNNEGQQVISIHLKPPKLPEPDNLGGLFTLYTDLDGRQVVAAPFQAPHNPEPKNLGGPFTLDTDLFGKQLVSTHFELPKLPKIGF